MTEFLYFLMQLWSDLDIFQEVLAAFGCVTVVECIHEILRGDKRYE